MAALRKEESRMENYCINCGTVLHPEFRLCPHCNRERLNQLISARRLQAFVPQQMPQSMPAFANQAAVVHPMPISQPVKTVERQAQPIQKTQRKRKPLLKILLAMVMTVVLLATSLVTLGIFSIRQATSEESLSAMVEGAEISDVISLLGADSETVFYGPIKAYVLENTGLKITNPIIDRVLEASELKYYLAEKAAVYAKDLYDGTDNFSFSQKEVYTLLRANRTEIEKVVKVSLSDEVLQEMADMLVNEELTEQIRVSVLKNKAPQVYYSLHFGLSYSAIAVLLAIAAMIWIAMLKLDFSLGFLGGGVALAVTGGLFALPGLLIKLSPGLLNTLLGNSFLQSVITGFLNTNLLVYLFIFTVGMAMILIRASILLLCRLFR